jgi:fibronectin-binding autotransporter adhesin
MVARALAAAGILGVLAGAILALSPALPAVAATGIHKTINFQGKVVNSNGTNVTNGSYSFQFKLYTVSSAGSAVWTETKSLTVTDGIFQTELGDTTALPGSVDFNTDNIYLGINFDPGTGYDGEMSPRIRFTASPYAFNSDLLDGLDASAFAQLNPSSAQSGSLNVTGTVQAATSLQAPLVDTATAAALSIGTGTATSVTIGQTTTPFTVQGNSSSTFTATSGSFTTTVGFTAPTANRSISFPDAGGTLCTTTASTCSATYQVASPTGYLAKNTTDTSAFAVTAANYLYGFTNSSSAVASGVLKLDNGSNTGDTLLVTASGSAGSGSALIVADNTLNNATGNLIDLRSTQATVSASRFAVDTAGNVTQAGDTSTTDTINGQRISSAANFTGTVTAATSLLAPLLDTASAGVLSVGTTNATAIDLNQSTVVAAGKSLTITGGNTASRPGSPTEGTMYYDTTTKQLLTYSNGKWQTDRNSSTFIVAASNASQAEKDGADYVAIGTTDQTIINTALAAAAGGRVYLTEGTYSLTDSISIPNNTTLAGAGRGTIVQFANLSGGSKNAITNTDTSTGTGVTIRDLQLDGNRSVNSSGAVVGVYMNGMGSGTGTTAKQGATVINVWANNFLTNGLKINNSPNSIVSNVMAVNNGIGIYIVSTARSNVSNNEVIGSTSYGIQVDSSINDVVSNNNVSTAGTYGIYLSTVSNTVVSGNNLRDNGGSGANDSIRVYSGGGINVSNNNSITGNKIDDTAGTGYAINIFDAAVNSTYLADNYYNGTGATAINDTGTGTIFGGQLNGSGAFVIQPAGGIALNGNTIVTGSLTQSGGAVSLNDNSNNNTGINTGTSTGTITLGGGSAPLVIDSTNFDVSSAGALSGITTIATSGTINSQTISSAANFTGTVTIQGANALTLGVTGTSTGEALFKGATAVSGTITLVGQANPTNNTLTLPNETGTLCVQAAATCGFTVGSGTAFVQGGNSFSAAGNLGTNDSNALNIRTNNATRLTISTTGDLTFASGSGGFDQSATSGTFKTGTGAVSLNGATTVTGSNTFNVGTGLSTLGGGLTETGTAQINATGSATTTVGSVSAGAVQIASGGASSFAVTGATLALSGTNFSLNTAGVLSLAGGQTADIVTPGASTATALTMQPGASSGASSNGPALNLLGGDATGTTSVTAGSVVIQGGNATGASGTRNGGSVTIDAGTGGSPGVNGTVSIGGTNANAVSIGRTGKTTTNNGALTVTQVLTANGGEVVNGTLSVAASNTSGNSVTISNTSFDTNAASLERLTFTNANTTNSFVGASGLSIAPTGTANTNPGVNELYAINLSSVTPVSNNDFTAVKIGTGYNNVLVVNGSSVINGSGVLQSAALSGTYSNALTLSNASNAFTGTYNGLTLTSAADGFTVTGGTIPRQLTVTGAAITIGSVIQPTSSGTLAVKSNGANALSLDAGASGGGSAVNIGTTNASGITVGNATTNPNITFNGSGTFGTTTGAVSLNGSTTVTGSGTLSVNSGLTTLGGGLAVTATGIANNGFGITGAGAISGATTISANSTISTSGTGANELAVTGTPLAGAGGGSSSLVQIGPNAISGGNSTATTGGTYIGIRAPSSGAGSTADFINFQNVGSGPQFTVSAAGLVSAATGYVAAGATGSTLSACAAGSYVSSFAATGGLVTGGACTALPNANAFVQGGNSFTAAADLGTNDNYGLNLRTNGTTRLAIGAAGDINQTFSGGHGAVGLTVTATDAASSGVGTFKGQAITLTGTNNASGSNTVIGLDFSGVAVATNNSFTAINVGSNFNNVLTLGGTPLITGAGYVQNAAIDSSVTYSNLTKVGALTVGSIASGFGTIATANTITGTTINGTTGINTGASAGTQRIDSSGNLVNIGNITGTAGITVSTTGSGTGNALALQPASGSSITGNVTKNAATGNEVAYDLAAIISKATSGNYTGIKLDVTETSAPGAANLLEDLKVGGTTKFSVGSTGIVTTATLGTADTATLLCRNTSNQIATCTATLTGTPFIQGGNSFSATGVLGTNDANDLTIRTNSTTRITVTSAGAVSLAANSSLSFSSGTGSFDQSLSSGSFDTGTGNVTLRGNTTVASGKTFTVTNSASSLNGNVSVGTAGSTLFTNNSATLNSADALGDLANNGWTTASTTVDVYTYFTIAPAASGRSYTVPTPTTTTAGRVIYVSNIHATSSFTLVGGSSVLINPGVTATLLWNGSAWTFAGTDSSNLQAAYNNSTSPEIVLGTASTAGITVKDNATPISGNLLEVQNNGGTINYLAVTSAASTVTGNIVLTNGADRTISLQDATSGAGNKLTVKSAAGNSAGTGGTLELVAGAGGATGQGGAATLFGGAAGGGNNDGGAVTVQGGAAAGTGTGGAVAINGGTAGGTTVATGGAINLTAGNGSAAVAGGTGGGIIIKAGDATGTGAFNGGDIQLTAGNASAGGTGVPGVVKIDTPVFTSVSQTYTQTGNNQAFPAAGAETTTTQSNIDNNGTLNVTIAGAFTGATLTIPSPRNNTAGRVLYITVSSTSATFTLAATGMPSINMIANDTAMLVWNGTAWTASAAASSLQQVYNNTSTSPASIITTSASKNLLFQAGVGFDNSAVFQVANSVGANMISVDTTNTATGLNLMPNSGAETVSGFSTTYPTTGFGTVGSSELQTTSAGTFATGAAAVTVTATAANSGIRANLGATLANSTTYNIAFDVKTSSGTWANDIDIIYNRTGTTHDTASQVCSTSGTLGASTIGNRAAINSTTWTKVTCFITTSSTTGASDANIVIFQTASTTRTFYVDNISVIAQNSSGTQNVGNLQVGGPLSQGLTLLTLDSYASNPFTGLSNTNLLGSMYYDTTAGRIQCYETDGWGSCGASPNNTITLTPEYTGAVLNSSLNANSTGTMTANLCANSGTLTTTSAIQPDSSLCGSGQIFNYYRWTTTQSTAQLYDIFVRYTLPTTFKSFSGNLTMTARTSSTTNGVVTGYLYGYDSTHTTDGTLCGTGVDLTTSGGANVWSTGNLATSSCNFQAGDTIMFRVSLSAKSSAVVYASNITFTNTGK